MGQLRYKTHNTSKKKIKNAKIEANVEFIFKRLPHEQIPYHYRSADLFVHTSGLEAFGLVLAEAMACKAPTIATDVACCREVLGEAGIFFKQGDSQDLAEKIIELLADEDLRTTLGEEALKRVPKNSTWGKAAQEYLKLYQLSLQRS